LLGIEDAGEAETEAPDCLLLVGPQGIELPRLHLPMILGDSLSTCRWEGQPNRLSKATVKWPLLDDVAKAVSKPVTAHVQKVSHAPAAGFDVDVPLRKIVRQRRSAMTMDGETRMSRRAFYDMLQQVLPGNLCCRALPWRPAVHLALFVHRVDGLEPGLYALVSDKRDLKSLQSAMRDDFFWDTPHACPPGLPLYTLVTGDTQSLSQDVSCRQDIAADGCFSLGMITRFRELLERRGAWFYRALYWECGLVGQILYLAAEAAGLRATGIGCFFDDSMHNILDLRDDAWQDLYHLTVGAPVEDPRLTVLPGYPDEKHAL